MIAKARAERKAAEEKLKNEAAGASAAGAMFKQADNE